MRIGREQPSIIGKVLENNAKLTLDDSTVRGALTCIVALIGNLLSRLN